MHRKHNHSLECGTITDIIPSTLLQTVCMCLANSVYLSWIYSIMHSHSSRSACVCTFCRHRCDVQHSTCRYTPTPDHPEYPSATACFCVSVAEGWKRFFDSDALNMTLAYPAGSSWREPGITPEEDTALFWETLTDWTQVQCYYLLSTANKHASNCNKHSLADIKVASHTCN